jgi:pimeloyl-ACP methyl ester carboxylesterase
MPTFVFVNPVSGSTQQWQAEVGPALRDAGYGTLAYNFRGQPDSPFSSGKTLNDALISGDLRLIIDTLEIARPVLVGLSIGGLFAAQTHLAGLVVDGLVLINTLRKIGPRISWINDAVVRVMEVGGPQLMADMMTPLLWGPDWLTANRGNFIQPDTKYAPLDKESGTYNLLKNMGTANWDIHYEKIACPVLVVMGLNDRVFFDASVVDELMARIPNSQRVDIQEAGHMLPIETPGPLIDALLDFGKNL